MKHYIKILCSTICMLLVSPLIFSYLVLNKVTTDEVIASYSQFLSLIPGKFGSYIRVSFYGVTLARCHRETVIGFGTLFSRTDVELECGVYIGPQCNIGKCIVRKDCLVGSGVHILAGKKQHIFDDVNTPIQQQGQVLGSVEIGEDSWIGNGALIMANVGKKCIIGAGAVVNKDVPDYSIVVGNPAKLVGKRA